MTAGWESNLKPLISVVVPCLNERKVVDQTLERLLALGTDVEIIFIDGGSTDGTLERLTKPPIRLCRTRKGRGHQLDFGARAATGEVLWFLHADTLITPEAADALRRVAGDQSIKSGNFRLIFDGQSAAAKCMTRIYCYLRLIGLCYGDSGFFVRADVYRQVGGFKDVPIFEDLDLLRRLKKVGPFIRLPATITTSSRRVEGLGLWRAFTCWTFLQVLYWLGVDPRRLGNLYQQVR
jgi:rSAM/selenodomain-associated transferase 2